MNNIPIYVQYAKRYGGRIGLSRIGYLWAQSYL